MKKSNQSSASGSAAGAAQAPDRSIEYVLSQAATPTLFCSALSKLFAVRLTEVALLRLERGLLSFLFPEELKTAGSIPVSSSSAVAAHTASTKKVELFNSFVKVKHVSIFETVKLGNVDKDNADQPPSQLPIQKLMSAPVLSPEHRVMGVIQVCRKGYDSSNAGPDFSLDDLQQLELAAAVAAKMPFMKK